jgi:hypothetical protein
MSNKTYADAAGPNMTQIKLNGPHPPSHQFSDTVAVLPVVECEGGEGTGVGGGG